MAAAHSGQNMPHLGIDQPCVTPGSGPCPTLESASPVPTRSAPHTSHSHSHSHARHHLTALQVDWEAAAGVLQRADAQEGPWLQTGPGCARCCAWPRSSYEADSELCGVALLQSSRPVLQTHS